MISIFCQLINLMGNVKLTDVNYTIIIYLNVSILVYRPKTLFIVLNFADADVVLYL